MILATFVQQPNDSLDYDIPYTLASGDSLASASVTSVTPTTSPALTVTATTVGSRTKLWVSDGAAGNTYKVTFKTVTAQGREKEDEVRIRVKDY